MKNKITLSTLISCCFITANVFGATVEIKLDNTKSLQEAINNIQKGDSATIYLKNGIYREKLIIDKPNITLIGEERGKVILDWDDAAGTTRRDDASKTYGTSGSATILLKPSAEGFRAENIVFSNSFDFNNSTFKDKQAVAIRNDADKSVFINCNFLGHQDTLYANTGRQYYKNSYIEGNVDFIFGAAQAFFENCEIFSKDRGDASNNGYVTAASTKETEEFGYIFDNCNFISDTKAGTVSLGRPWHPGKKPGTNPSVIILNSQLGDHIKEVAWASMSGFSPDDARFFEYGNTGDGVKESSNRRVLSQIDSTKYTKNNIFKDWKPE